MKMKDSQGGAGSRGLGSSRRTGAGETGVTQLIRSAEKFIASHKYAKALEQLGAAKQMEPGNTYIQAIIDRIYGLQQESPAKGGTRDVLGSRSDRQAHRYLSVTVGAEFDDGIKDNDTRDVSAKDIQVRVRHLTDVAEKFLERGSYENAFDSLFKAYLLDPVSPYVMACEKTVLPAWEFAHRQSRVGQFQADSFELPGHDGKATPTSSAQGLGGPDDSSISFGGADQSEADRQRLEMLKQQREAERQERERALWRQASKPPKIYGEEELENEIEFPSLKVEPRKPERGFFLKLKRGKFLG